MLSKVSFLERTRHSQQGNAGLGTFTGETEELCLIMIRTPYELPVYSEYISC